MAPRKPRDSAPIVPTVPAPTVPSNRSNNQLATALSALPEKLEMAYPDFASQIPKDWFKPSTSSTPRTTTEQFREESEIAREQSNSLRLQSMNLDNALLTATNAVKATKVGKACFEYLVGLEEIKAVGVKLRNAQAITANQELQVAITQEQGSQLNQKLAGAQIKTQIESAKNAVSSLELDYQQQLKPIKAQEWKNRLLEAQSKADLALDAMNGSQR